LRANCYMTGMSPTETAGFEQLIVHQFDPAEQIAGGIHGFIADFVRLAPPEHHIRLVGVDASGGRRLGVWVDAAIGGRPLSFLPVARLSAGRQRRRIPHTLRLLAGLVVHRPRPEGAIVHAHRSETALLLTLLYPRSQVVQFVHTDSEEALRHRTETFWRFLPRVHLWLEALAVKRSARTWVFNATAAERLAKLSPNVRAASNWFDGELFRPAADHDDRPLTVGWIGRLETPKDPLKAADVFGELARAGVPFAGWFAGSGTLEAAVAERVAALGVEGSVTLLGTLGPSELAERLRRTDVLIVTSLWEGQPRAVLEALGSGVPVVSNAVGDVPRIVVEGESGFIARSGSAAELAELTVRAGRLRDREAVAATVGGYRAVDAVSAFFAELQQLSRPTR